MANIWDILKGVGSAASNLAEGYADANPYMTGRGGRSYSANRQATADMLRERLFNERQKQQQQQFEQRQAGLDQREKDLNSRRQQQEEDQQAKQKLAQSGQDFNQAVTAGDLLTKNWQLAPTTTDSAQVTRPGATPEEVAAAPEAEREFITTTPYTEIVPGIPQTDTQGRPSITAGGATLIPRTPEEQDQYNQERLNKQFQDFAKTHPDYAKNHQDDLDTIAAHATFGWTPPEKTKGNLMDGLFEKALKGDAQAKALYEQGKALQAKEPRKSGLSPGALDTQADIYNTTGRMLGFGIGGIEDREAIMNRAHEKDPNANPILNGIAWETNRKSFEPLVKNYDQLMQYEHLAGDNMDMMLNEAKKIPNTDIGWLNKPLREVNRNTLGNTSQAVFDALKQTSMTENARVIQNMGLSNVLHEGARQDIQHLIDSGATANQIIEVSKAMAAERYARRREAEAQISRVASRFGTGIQKFRDMLHAVEMDEKAPGVTNDYNTSPANAGRDLTLHTPVPKGKVRLRLTKNGVTSDRDLDPVADKDKIAWGKSQGAVEVK